jgi:O-antigen/teichoic acid export membrane protein
MVQKKTKTDTISEFIGLTFLILIVFGLFIIFLISTFQIIDSNLPELTQDVCIIFMGVALFSFLILFEMVLENHFSPDTPEDIWYKKN